MTTRTVPGPAGTPLLGSLRDLSRNTLDTYLRAHRDFGDVVRFTAGPPGMRGEFYALFGHEGVQKLLATEAANFRKDHSFYAEVRELIGNGLLTSQDGEYIRQRRLIQPLFTRRRVDEYATDMSGELAALMTQWCSAHDDTVDVAKEMTRLTLRIVARVLFGADVEAAVSGIRRHFPVASASVVKRGFAPVRIPRNWPTPTNRRVKAAQDGLYAICDDIIADRRPEDSDANDMLSLLMRARTEDGDRLSGDEIRDQVLVFLLAGHETTAVSLAFALHLLAAHPQIQARAAAEVDEVLAGKTPTAQDLNRLTYTTMVVKEAMRLYPAAPLTGRLSVDETFVAGHRIPAGANVVVSSWVTHRHPDYWEDPERFDPERFTADNEKERPRYAWFPFGGGPRACIGSHFAILESVLTLAMLLQTFNLDPIDRDVDVTTAVTLRPTGPMRCRLTPR